MYNWFKWLGSDPYHLTLEVYNFVVSVIGQHGDRGAHPWCIRFRVADLNHHVPVDEAQNEHFVEVQPQPVPADAELCEMTHRCNPQKQK